MNKRLLLIVLLVVAIVSLVTTALIGKSRRSDACGLFLTKIEQNDADGSYALLTTRITSSVTKANWSKQMQELSSLYNNAAPKLVSQTNITRGGQKEVEKKYTVTNGLSVYDITCDATPPTGSQRIDSFTNVAKQ